MENKNSMQFNRMRSLRTSMQNKEYVLRIKFGFQTREL